MSAGFAAADVAVSGSAKMGVVSTNGTAAFKNKAVISFKGTGTTDGGLAFGAGFDADDAVAAEGTGTSGSAFISGAFGKITMGSVASGDSAAVGQLASVGFNGLESGNSIGYAADASASTGLPGSSDTVSAARVLYTYSAGALTINASTAQLSPAAGGPTAYGIGGSYTTGGLTMAVGYGAVDGLTTTGIKAYDIAGTAGDAGVAAVYGAITTTTGTGVLVTAPVAAVTSGWYETKPLNATVTDISLSATYVMDNTTIKAIYQNKTIEASATARTDVEQVITGTLLTTAIGTAGVHGHGAINLSTTATSMGLSVVQKMDALSLTAYGINTTVDAAADLSSDNPTVSRYGIGFGYDLGGGASFSAGWATIDAMVATAIVPSSTPTTAVLETYTLTSVSADTWDLGLNFSF